MNTQTDKNQILAALHILIARIHLAIAGVRRLTDEERYLIQQLTEFMDQRNN